MRVGSLRRALASLLVAACVGTVAVTTIGLDVAPATAAPPAGSVVSTLSVSPAPAQQLGGCSVSEVRATQRWWMFGAQIQMDFRTSGSAAPVISTSPGRAAEGSTVVTDTEGNLRFWSNGIDVWGADGKPIKNSGGGKGMSSSAQTVVAMPALGSPGKYYVVMSGYQAEMGNVKAPLYYSVIDMNANGGKGEMIQKNIQLGTPGVAGEGLAATPNAAGDGFWVYSVASNSNRIYRWEFKGNGPVSTTPQYDTMPDTFTSYSTIHFDGRHGSNQGVVFALRSNIYTLLAVNRSTGKLTQGFRIQHQPQSGSGWLYGAAFSPSGRYLYYSDIYGTPSYVYRVDLTKTSATAVRNSRVNVAKLQLAYAPDGSGGGLKLGPDGNIWANEKKRSTHVVKITNPESASPTVSRVQINAGSGGSVRETAWGLPDMVTGCEKRIPQITATVSAPKDLTLGDAISPVGLHVTNSGNTRLTQIAVSGGLATCPKTALEPGESMDCAAPSGAWGSVTQAQNDAGVVKALGYTVSGRGSIGADPNTGQERPLVQVTAKPAMDLRVVTTYRLSFEVGADGLEAPAPILKRSGQPWGAMPEVSLPGRVFLGWSTTEHPVSGGNTASMANVTSATTATRSLTVYPVWRPAKFNIVFDGNADLGATVEGSMASIIVESGSLDRLPANAFTRTSGARELLHNGDTTGVTSRLLQSRFLGWSLDPEARSAGIADQAVAGELSLTDGVTLRLYAVWDDAPQFVAVNIPNRFFNVTQAQRGGITEAELLRTVSAKDRETKPLEPKTAHQVAASDDVGITLYDYDANDFTSMTEEGGIVTVTYQVKDAIGNTALLRINVTVSNDAPVPPVSRSYLRSISPEYANESPHNGGLLGESLWRTDPTRESMLDNALSGASSTGQCFKLTASDVAAVKQYVLQHGLGNSGDDSSALAGAVALLQGTKQSEGTCIGAVGTSR